MKKERYITLTLKKAKEWYKRGGELKEVALQAFSEEELTKPDLPKSWKEFCKNYPIQDGECWLSGCDEIYEKGPDIERIYKNWIPSKKSAEAHLALNGNLLQMGGDDALREIIRLGTSAGGAQAKAVVGWKRSEDSYVTGDVDLPEGFEHWIVKFSPKALPDAGHREYEIYLKAREAGIDMSECRLLTIDGCSHFMTKRFDREGAQRFHVQTLCALRHLPPGGPRELYSYETLFETADVLGLDYEAREEIFRRMAFNVYNREMDDHTKNFSFLMTEDGVWRLAPAYDLTGEHFSDGDDAWGQWQNQHALSVNGKFSNITDEDVLSVGERWAVGSASRVLQEVQKVFK